MLVVKTTFAIQMLRLFYRKILKHRTDTTDT